ncbi:MAG: hypothetical protein ACYCSN_14575 [Acidobacteriaceae bacterium]
MEKIIWELRRLWVESSEATSAAAKLVDFAIPETVFRYQLANARTNAIYEAKELAEKTATEVES